MQQLLAVLERERERMETLGYRLASAVHLLAAGERRFLGLVVDDLDHAADALHLIDDERRVVAGQVAHRLGLAPGVTLQVLIAAVGGSDRVQLERAREELRRLWEENRQLIEQTTALSHAGAASLRSRLERLATGHEDLQYGTAGRPSEMGPTAFDTRA